jgi:hypothetical protein
VLALITNNSISVFDFLSVRNFSLERSINRAVVRRQLLVLLKM